MDQVLGRDVPELMARFPPEREERVRAAAQPAAAPSITTIGGGGAAMPAARPPVAATPQQNPFDLAFSTAAPAPAAGPAWAVTDAQRTKYAALFQQCGPVDGKVGGEAAREVLLKSRLDYETLGKVWNLSDIDQDGYLDGDEFAVAMHLCHQVMEGTTLGDSLDPALIPPSKR